MFRALVPCALAALLPTVALAEDWPQFRGPTGQGVTTVTDLPLTWSKDKNVAWKTPIPGRGWSSPVVVGGRIWLTTAVPGQNREQSLRLVCLDASTGRILWDREVFRQEAGAPRIHNKNSHASPSPIVDGPHIYVHFGHQGTACYDRDGKQVWANRTLRYQPVHGNGGTPILVDDKLIFSIDGADKQLVVALNRATGNVVWKTDRKSTAFKKFSFSTPLLIQVDGKPQVISPGSDMVAGYDPADGKEIWRVRYDGYSVIPKPVHGHGLLFLSSGYDRPSLRRARRTRRRWCCTATSCTRSPTVAWRAASTLAPGRSTGRSSSAATSPPRRCCPATASTSRARKARPRSSRRARPIRSWPTTTSTSRRWRPSPWWTTPC
jgi:outer membrane protein assembly factor BamB